MADQPNFIIPKPPDSADINELHTYAKDMYTFLVNIMQAGVQVPFFSQNQISQMTSLTQAGKIFFNNDTGKFMGGEVSGGMLSLKTFFTSQVMYGIRQHVRQRFINTR